jgi:hypothetical protein
MNERPVIRRLASKDDPEGVTRFRFPCPGCEYGHWVRVNAADSPNWTWNGDFVRPTFSPSVHVFPGGSLQTKAEGARDGTCHSHVIDGNIQFLSDCWHDLKNQTVPLPPLDYGD